MIAMFCADERCDAYQREPRPADGTSTELPEQFVEALHADGWRLGDDGLWRCEQHAEVDA